MPSGPRVRPAQSQLSATAPKRAEAVSRIVSKTLRLLTGDRRFESISLHRRVTCEPDVLALSYCWTVQARPMASSPRTITQTFNKHHQTPELRRKAHLAGRSHPCARDAT